MLSKNKFTTLIFCVLTMMLFVMACGATQAEEVWLDKAGLGQKMYTQEGMTAYPNPAYTNLFNLIPPWCSAGNLALASPTSLNNAEVVTAQNEVSHQFQTITFYSSLNNGTYTPTPAIIITEKESRPEQEYVKDMKDVIGTDHPEGHYFTSVEIFGYPSPGATHYVVIANYPEESFTGGYLSYYYPSPGTLLSADCGYYMRNIYAEKPTSGVSEGKNGYHMKAQAQKRPMTEELALITDPQRPQRKDVIGL